MTKREDTDAGMLVVLALPSRPFWCQPGPYGVRAGWLRAEGLWGVRAERAWRLPWLPGRGVEVPYPIAAGNRLEGRVYKRER